MAHFYLLLLRNETVWNPLWKEIVSAQNVLELHTLVEASSPHGFLWGHKPWNPSSVELGGTSAKPETLQPQEALHHCSALIGIRMRARNHHKSAPNTRCPFSSLLIKTHVECADVEEEILTTQFAKEWTSPDRWQSYHLMFEYTVEKTVGTWVQRELVLEIYGSS